VKCSVSELTTQNSEANIVAVRRVVEEMNGQKLTMLTMNTT
jgi:hypothetical protein